MTIDNAKILSDYIDDLPDFKILIPDYPYSHMGATITDAILQAGLKWETVVKPRIKKLKKEYPDADTMSGFKESIDQVGIEILINWSDSEKIERIKSLVAYLSKYNIETESDLKTWLLEDTNAEDLKCLRGVGNKTVDYLKSLVGIPTAAVDRYMINIVGLAGINTTEYHAVKDVINTAADIRGINRSHFDYSIWKYMSEKSKLRVHKTKGEIRCTGGGEKNMIFKPHQGDIHLKTAFDEIWNYTNSTGAIKLNTASDKEFETKAGFTKGKQVIKFYQKGIEYARSYQCCWGHYYNCNGTRFGMYASAIDNNYQKQHKESVYNAITAIAHKSIWGKVSKERYSASSPIHGLNHWERVFENGYLIAKETGTNTDLIELFALFHDSCRLNDGNDPEHGKRAAEWVASMRSDLPNLSDELFKYLLEAICDHTHVKKTDNIHIAACWDADRLDLGRVGKTPSAEFMNTDVGKKIAGQIVESKYLRSDVDDNVKNYVCRLIESHESRREPMGKDDLTQKQKDVYKVVKAIFEETGNMNVFGTEIKNKYQQLHGRPMQLLLSDLCYNRVNVGPDHEAKFLFYEKSGAYRFVDFAAESDIRIPIIWNPKGKNVPRELSGRQFCVGQYYQGKYNWDFTDIRAF